MLVWSIRIHTLLFISINLHFMFHSWIFVHHHYFQLIQLGPTVNIMTSSSCLTTWIRRFLPAINLVYIFREIFICSFTETKHLRRISIFINFSFLSSLFNLSVEKTLFGLRTSINEYAPSQKIAKMIHTVNSVIPRFIIPSPLPHPSITRDVELPIHWK